MRHFFPLKREKYTLKFANLDTSWSESLFVAFEIIHNYEIVIVDTE